MTKHVHELMHHGLITCGPELTLGQVARRLYQTGIHALVVADADGKPLGVISDFDLLTGEWLSGDAASLQVMRRMTAGEMMSLPLQTISAEASVAEAAARMKSDGVHRLVVLEGGKAVGVISIGDLIKHLAGFPVRRETVADVMSRAVVVCRQGTPLKDAARAMTDRHSRSLVVLGAAGRPVGVVTGWDLLEVCDEDCGDRTVDQVMHAPLTIDPAAPLRQAVDLMIKHRVHRLVVADPGNPDALPLGVISTSDLFAEMARPGSVWLPEG